jgi:hypothetical protein
VVLELPDGQFGVIDCYCDPFGRSATLDFLRRRFDARSLLFVAITHPHADHCAGVGRLLEEMPAEELWVFEAIQCQDLYHYYYQLFNRGEKDSVEVDLDLKRGATFEEILGLRKRFVALARKRSPGSEVRLIRSKVAFEICNRALRFRFLTPGDKSLVNYRERLFFGSLTTSVNPNLASGTMLIEYGRTRLLLMADAEAALWNDWSHEQGTALGLEVESVHFIKVAHHGSLNGYHAQLYRGACEESVPLAVVTPFTRSRMPLPSRDGIDRLRSHLSQIVCTNRQAAERSTGYRWKESSSSRRPPSLPAEWAVEIARDPRLALCEPSTHRRA